MKDIIENMEAWSDINHSIQNIAFKAKGVIKDIKPDDVTGEELQLLQFIHQQLLITLWFSNYIRRAILENQDSII